MGNDVVLPEDIDYTSEDIKEAGKRPKLSNGWYRFACQDERRGATQKNDLMVQLTLAPLTDPDDADSASKLTIRHFLILPFVNKTVEGHKAPDSVWRCHAVLSGFMPDVVPPTPRKVDGVTVFQGREIDGRAAYEEAQEVCKAAAFEACKKLWKNEISLANDDGHAHVVYAEIYENGEFQNLRKFSSELPENVELVKPEDFKQK